MIKMLFVLLLPAFLLAGQVAASGAGLIESPPPVESTIGIPATLDLEPGDFPGERAAVSAKLDAALTRLVVAQDRAGTAAGDGLRLEEGRVQAQLVVAPGGEESARAAVAAAGGEVTGAFEGVLQAWLLPDGLIELAARPEIDYIRRPDSIVLAENDAVAAASEGMTAANAAAWHAAGWRGQGTRIAIIDAGFQGYAARLGIDLPQAVTVKNFVDGQPDAEVGSPSDTKHGTACAEIAYDMAPMAQMYLLKISTDVDLNEAIDYAISQRIDVISTSLTFVNVTPGDGTGRFATMAQRARDAGILWVTAAGNYRETHWSGAFNDTDGDGLHEYASGVEVNVFGPGNGTAFLIPAGTSLSPSIRWDDWTALNQDLRLLLLRYNGSTFEIVAGSNNPQTGQSGQRPTERISYVTGGAAAIYGVAVQRNTGSRAVYMHLLTPNRELDRRVSAISLGNLADVAAVMTTAAVDVDVPFVREDYSSEGPTNGPGGAPGGGFLKPDIAAFANVTTTSYGTRAFSGTSAATPHVAGAAALVLSAYPTAAPGEAQDYLQTQAANQGVPGPDAQFGYGRLLLGAPPGPWDYDNQLYIPAVLVSP